MCQTIIKFYIIDCLVSIVQVCLIFSQVVIGVMAYDFKNDLVGSFFLWILKTVMENFLESTIQ